MGGPAAGGVVLGDEARRVARVVGAEELGGERGHGVDEHRAVDRVAAVLAQVEWAGTGAGSGRYRSR